MASGEETNEAIGQSDERGEEGETSRCNSLQKAESMAPWEQHSAVISLPRYDYAVPSSLLHRSRSGFLITCPIKREKSATKEAMSLFGEFASSRGTCSTETRAKKRKLLAEVDPENAETAARNSLDNISEPCDDDLAQSLNLSLVKLTRSGLLLLTFPNNNSHHVVDILSDIFCSLASQKLKPPLWCHRIFPIQETCILAKKDLQLVVSKLVEDYLGKDQEKLERHIKFAVGYNRRGMEDEINSQKGTAKDTQASTLLDRDACFKAVAGAVKAVAKNAIVDLKSPEVAVLVELLPISGIPQGLLVAGVSVLPLEFVTIKPRLCIKSLIADVKGHK